MTSYASVRRLKLCRNCSKDSLERVEANGGYLAGKTIGSSLCIYQTSVLVLKMRPQLQTTHLGQLERYEENLVRVQSGRQRLQALRQGT